MIGRNNPRQALNQPSRFKPIALLALVSLTWDRSLFIIYSEFSLAPLKFYRCFEDLLPLLWFWFCATERECTLHIAKLGMDASRLVNLGSRNVPFYSISLSYSYMGLGEVHSYHMMVIDLHENQFPFIDVRNTIFFSEEANEDVLC